MDNSQNSISLDNSTNKLGGLDRNDENSQAGQMIEPLPAYGIQYFPYQQREQHQERQQPANEGNGAVDHQRRIQNEQAEEDTDDYRPLPINSPPVREQQPQQEGQDDQAPMLFFPTTARTAQGLFRPPAPANRGSSLTSTRRGSQKKIVVILSASA